MAQVVDELRGYEDALYGGDFLCVYSLLRQLLDFLAADCAGVLRRRGGQDWIVEHEVGALGSELLWSELASDPVIREALDTLECQLIGWERPEWRGCTHPVMTVRVWSKARARSGEPDVAVLAFFHPRRIHRDPQTARDTPVVRRCHHLITLWFALAGYRRITREGLKSVQYRDEHGAARNCAIGPGRWPVSFAEAADLIEEGMGNKGPCGNVGDWVTACLSALHLNDSPSCLSRDERGNPDCEKNRRTRMAELSSLIPLRTLRADNLRMEPWKAGLAEYRKLRSLSRLFREALNTDRINEKALVIAFAERFWVEWLGAPNQRLLGESEFASPADLARMLSSCARIAHYALEDMASDDQTIEALMWAVSKYAHEVLGVDPRLEIGSHLLHASRNEPALHALKPYYRDHFLHAIEVCFLGHFLLNLEYAKGQSLLQLFRRLMKVRSGVEVLRAWYVAALLHDVGYAIDVLKNAGSMLEFFQCSDRLKKLTKGVGSVIESLSAELKVDFAGVEAPGRDHGIIAAEHLKHLVQTITAKGESTAIYDHAVHAVAAHNVRSEKVEFKEHPLAFLLILCDTIQEWNRPHLRFSTAPAEILALMTGGAATHIADLTGPLEHVGVNLIKEPLRLRMRNRKQLEFTLQYGPAIRTNSGVINLWLDSCSNLQRLGMVGLPFNIRLIYRTPVFRNSRGDTELQIHRLRQAADETHMSFLSDWFPASATNRAVLSGSDGDGLERLEIDLQQLTKTRRIKADMDAIRERLSKWRRYNEDRDFAGDYAPITPGFPFRRDT